MEEQTSEIQKECPKSRAWENIAVAIIIVMWIIVIAWAFTVFAT